MDVAPFDLFIEFIYHSQRLATSRLGRLIKNTGNAFTHRNARASNYKAKPARVHTLQVEKPLSFTNSAKGSKEVKQTRHCNACDAVDHAIWHCDQFAKKSVSERKGLVKQKRLCFNCLGLGHAAVE